MPAEVAAQQVGAPGGQARHHLQALVALEVEHGNQRGLQRFAKQAQGLLQVLSDLQRVSGVGCALMHTPALAQHAVETADFLPARIGAGQAFGPLAVAVDLVPLQAHGRQAEKTDIQRRGEDVFHLLQFAFSWHHGAVGGAVQAHHPDAQVAVAKQADDVRAHGLLLDKLDPLQRVGPGFVLLQDRQHLLARHGFHPGEDVRGILGRRADHAQRATADQHRGHAVAHRLGQTRGDDQLGIVMGVGVEKPRRHPLAGGIDQGARLARVDGLGADQHHLAVAYAEVTDG